MIDTIYMMYLMDYSLVNTCTHIKIIVTFVVATVLQYNKTVEL